MKAKNKRPSKILLTVSLVFNVILLLLYGIFIYASLGLFEGIPWYSDDVLFYNYILWIPICAVTVIVIVLAFLTGMSGRSKLIILCLNALYIPCEAVLNAVKSTMSLIAIISFVTIITYVIIFVNEIVKKYIPAYRGK